MTNTTPVPTVKNPILSDAWYTRLEYMGRVGLPALATLYLALSTLWALPKGPEVVGTIVAVDTFLGLFLGYASKSYDASDAKYDGSMDVTITPEGMKTFLLNLNGDPSTLGDQPKVTFKVNAVPPA